MNLKEIIEKAEVHAGGQKALSLKIGMGASNIRNAKAGQCGLPIHVCIMIADMIEMDRIEVIKASELVTEKKEERRNFWQSLTAKAASVTMAAVILNMTPTPSEAKQIKDCHPDDVYYVK